MEDFIGTLWKIGYQGPNSVTKEMLLKLVAEKKRICEEKGDTSGEFDEFYAAVFADFVIKDWTFTEEKAEIILDLIGQKLQEADIEMLYHLFEACQRRNVRIPEEFWNRYNELYSFR